MWPYRSNPVPTAGGGEESGFPPSREKEYTPRLEAWGLSSDIGSAGRAEEC